jgi:hypothetical protein
MSEFNPKMLSFSKRSPFIYYSHISYYNEVSSVSFLLGNRFRGQSLYTPRPPLEKWGWGEKSV